MAVTLTASALVAFASCHRDASPPLSFVHSLRCGMTRTEVTQLAHEHGYGRSDKSWLTRSATNQPRKPKELSLVDLRFRGDRLVGLTEGNYDPRTKRVEYNNVDLCNPAAARNVSAGR